MAQCWAPGFPKNSKTRNHWKKLTRRTVKKGTKSSSVDVDGKKTNGSTLFAYNKEKQLRFPFHEKRSRMKTAEQSVVFIEEVDSRYGERISSRESYVEIRYFGD
nr:unnamed protein product [Callosobruchus chinensis]